MFFIPRYYTNILIIACILDLYIVYLAWKRRTTPGSRSLLLLMMSMAIWAIGASISHTVTDVNEKIFWIKVSYIGFTSTPSLILLFTLAYTRNTRWTKKQYLIANSIIPLITLILAFTNERHHLVWQNSFVIEGINALIFFHGPWYYGFIGYSYLLILLSPIIFLRSSIRQQIRPSHAIAIVTGLLFPWIGNFIYVLNVEPFRGLDMTPIGFTITGLILIWSIYRLRLLDLMPIAREKVIDSMYDCLLVIDNQERIVDVNPAMQKCISKLQDSDVTIPQSKIIGFSASEIMENCPKLISIIHSKNEEKSEIELCSDTETEYYDLEITPIFNNKKNKVGKMILLRDITSYKKAVQAEAEARGLAEALQEAGTALGATLDLDDLMELIMEMIGRVLTFDSGTVLLLEDDRLRVSAINGLAEKEMEIGKTISIYDHPDYEVLTQKKTKIFPDIQNTYPNFRDGLISLISAPLISHHRIIGFLNLGSTQAGHFTEKDIEKINAFAIEVSIALENARLYLEAQRRLTEQSILNEISRSITAKLNLSEFLERVYQQIRLYVDIQNFFVSRYDDATDEFEFVYTKDTAFEMANHDKEKYTSNDGFAGYIIQTRSPLLLNSQSEVEEFCQLTKRQPLWGTIKSFMGVPLIVGEKIVGVIASHHYNQEYFFNTNDYNLFILVSTQIAVAFENAHLFAKMEKMAITDTLTGLFNRRHFLSMAENEMMRSIRYQIPISVIMFDIDHFKKVNDTYGHPVGDLVLQKIAGVCRHTLRKTDIIGRYGGEEFLILLPETNLLDAMEVAERLRQDIKQCSIETQSGNIHITASLGLSTQKDDYSASFSNLIEEADQAMYTAKQQGRDQVRIYSEN